MRVVCSLAIVQSHCAESEIEWQTDEMLEALGDAAVIAGPSGTILDLNNAACKLLGYPRNRLIGQNVTIMMPESIARNHASYLQRYLETGEKRLIGKPRKFTVYRANGSEVSIQLCLGELPNTQTGEVRFLGRMRTDIEEASSTAIVGAIDAAIDAAFAQAKEEISKSVGQNLTVISGVLEKYRSAAGGSVTVTDTDDDSITDTNKDENDDTLQVSFANVEVHDRISEGGGSGAIIYNCTVDGWACVMKEVNLSSLKGDKIMTILNEVRRWCWYW
jgi:two-component system, LuxR family, sensor kinase FixL